MFLQSLVKRSRSCISLGLKLTPFDQRLSRHLHSVANNSLLTNKFVNSRFKTSDYNDQPITSLSLINCPIQMNVRPLSFKAPFPVYYRGNRGVASREKEVGQSPTPSQEPEKLGLFQKYKKMYKEYWYVLVPVHLATSAVWFGSFYYLAASGFDAVYYLEKIGAPDKLLNLMHSAIGNVAVTLVLYKLATPLRYAVTLGGTTVSINYLRDMGLIKPAPTPTQFKDKVNEMYKARKRLRGLKQASRKK